MKRPASNSIRTAAVWRSATLLMAIGVTLAGAEPATNTPAVFTLEDCLAIGLERAVTLGNAFRDESIAGAKIRQVRAQIIPQLSGKANYTRLDKVSSYAVEDEEIETGQLDNYTVAAEASQLLFSGGSVAAALKAAGLYRDRARIGVEQTRRQLIRDITTAFNNILLARANVTVQEESTRQLEGFVRQTEAHFQHDTASEFDLLSARVRLANELPRLIAARKDLEIAKAAFRNLIHLDETEYDLRGELAFVPWDAPLAELPASARRQRPEVRQQQKLIGLWEADIRAEQGRYAPQLRARAAYEGQRPSPYGAAGNDDWRWGWNAGLVLDWAVFDGGLREARIFEKRLELEKARANLTELERGVALEVQQAYLEMRHAEETVNANRENIALAEKSLAIARTRYDAGLATYLEFTDSNLALSTARLTWLVALRNHMNAVAQLHYACGADTLEAVEDSTP